MDAPTREQRRFPRVQLLRPIVGQTVVVPDQFTLHDISLGGFAVEASISFVLGEIHPFQFATPDLGPIELRGQVKHSLRVNNLNNMPRFLTGFEFVGMTPQDTDVIALLIQSADQAS